MNSRLLLLLCVSLPLLGATEEPWGCDADLAQRIYSAPWVCQRNDPLVQTTRALICFHKGVISPADGPRSHFKPSSSEYMLQAVEKYGFFRGYLMGCDRLMRENKDPWIYRKICGDYHLITKWDPVP